MNLSHRLLLFLALCMLVFASPIESLSNTNNNNNNKQVVDMADLIRSAMEQTTKSQSSNSIAAAMKADRLWETILGVQGSAGPSTTSTPPPPPPLSSRRNIPDNIRAPSLSLHAATLSRLGKDRRAVSTYDAALVLKRYLSTDSIRDVCMGRGYALQRLLRYNEAREQFMEGLDHNAALGQWEFAARASVSAATCSLRLDDLSMAVGALERYMELQFQEVPDTVVSSLDAEVAGLYGFLTHVLQSGIGHPLHYESRNYKFIEYAAQKSSLPLYRWLMCTTSPDTTKSQIIAKYSQSIQTSFLDMAAMNQSPLDDSRMVYLDDKVHLQNLLSTTDDPNDKGHSYYYNYWPVGFILPDESDQWNKYVIQTHTSTKWMIKERAGYGSHGNYVAPTPQHVREYMQNDGDVGQVLCQSIVEPPLLLNGCKFSMRVYVILIDGHRNQRSSDVDLDSQRNSMDVYLCPHGLAKLASAPYEEGVYDMKNIDDAYMTNSGRTENNLSIQLDFQQLRAEFEERDWDYDKMWNSVAEAVRRTMRCFYDTMETKRIARSDLSMSLCLPKILGLDFLLDDDIQPKLIEINRFPGLEPRGSDDDAVKKEVVEDAWRLACDSEGIPYSFLGLKEKKNALPQKLQLYE